MNRQKEQRRSVFLCQECGYQSAKWFGFCPSPSCDSSLPLEESQAPSADPARPSWLTSAAEPLQELANLRPEDQQRIELASAELNRVLGGGVVPGSVILLAGEPGVGKSTLLLQVAQQFATSGRTVVYVSGEESAHQVKLRSQRLGFTGQGIFLLTETDVDLILRQLEESRPGLVIVDSVQTLYTADAPSGPGSVVQVRECALRLMRWAKTRNVPVFLAGHMTKDGSLAGPRVLEHMVDMVMYLEGQELNGYRILRSGKNRFGSTTEVGVFDMTSQGLIEVADPSQALLSQRYERAVGSVLVPVLEGSRPLLLEIQALTSPAHGPAPRRVGNGVDYNRLLMLAAVASRRAGLELGSQDVIVNVAGGFRVSEPAADLAVCLAVASSFHNQPLAPDTVAFGEVGLSGELRNVPQPQRRIREASRLGLSRCVLPETARRDVESAGGMELIFAATLRQAIRAAIGDGRGARQDDSVAAVAAVV